MPSHPALRLAVDIGGTFTDTVIAAPDNRVLATAKTLTTHDSPVRAALAGAREAAGHIGARLADIGAFIHGTTLATNALIERRGATVAAIATAGFRDILEIGYERRYSQYDINLVKPDLIVPRARCFTVPERLSVRGEVLEALDEDAVPELVGQLEACGAQAVAICLIHAYANGAHEARLRDLLLARKPDLAVSLSSEVSPEALEFERLCTTIANAYVQPLMSRYLLDFEREFAGEGLACPILMMTAGGGMTTLETARRFPVRLVESGPAGGAVLAARVAASRDERRVLSFDMGGTTAKLCLIDDYEPQTSRRFEIARASRFIKGSGMPVRIPVVDMIEIGAGGGSIAAVDRLGRLAVGPQSAGSEPGPAAFGRGGEAPTVTDADVVAGYIRPESFAEGRLAIDAAAAGRALLREIGAPLDLDAAGSAAAIGDIVDESMASAGRMHAVESGKDLAQRTMIAFGGNGPLHATRVARRAGVTRIVVPPDPGVGSAVGFLFAPVSYEIVRSRYSLLDDLDVAAINALFDALLEEAADVVRRGAPGGDLLRRRTAFMRYRGQGHEIEIELPDRALEPRDIERLRAAFEAGYRAQFSRAVPGMRIEILNWAVRVASRRGAVEGDAMDRDGPAVPEQSRASLSPSRVVTVTCDLTGAAVAAGVYERADLKPGARVDGPALIVEPQTTTLVSADFVAEVGGDGSLILSRTLATGETP
jgi:N-methylhydantoinase A